MKYVLGITGGSGVGKTTVSNILKDYGIDIVDADKVARVVMENGSECLKEVAGFFGEEILDDSRNLKRKELAKIVFSDPEKLKKLNEITHKYIIKKILKEIDDSHSSIVGMDAPLLFEAGLNSRCDAVLGVIADEEVRVLRIVKRDKISEEDAKERIASQKNNQFYIENCDFLVYNNGKEEDIISKIREVLGKLEHAEEEKRIKE